jgi:hypothetical protein
VLEGTAVADGATAVGAAVGDGAMDGGATDGDASDVVAALDGLAGGSEDPQAETTNASAHASAPAVRPDRCIETCARDGDDSRNPSPSRPGVGARVCVRSERDLKTGGIEVGVPGVG